MAAELYSKANEAFVEDDFEEALKLYTEAIEEDGEKQEYYSSRSHANIKLENYQEALADATKAIKLMPNNPKAYLRKGIANFHLEQFTEAKEDFYQGQCLDAGDPHFDKWKRKCDAELSLKENVSSQDAATPQVGVGVSDMAAASSSTSPQQPQLQMPPKPTIRHDWYQTETHVVVTILVKNVKKEDVHVDVQEKSLSATIKLPSGSDFNLELNLRYAVNPERAIIKVLSTKIEIKLSKVEGIQWEKLESDGEMPQLKHIPVSHEVSDVHMYPTSRHVHRDWDKMVAELKEEEKDEKLEGDAALNKLFSQIYSDGSDEVKKAMNKSFVQSGGTVLSTNWSEIGTKEVEVKPPDGMEYKKWSA